MILFALACIIFHPPLPPTCISPSNLCPDQVPVQSAHIVCNEPSCDFGRVRSGPTIYHEFPITNTSKYSVTVRAYISMIGTHAPIIHTIEPKETLKLPIYFHTSSRGSGSIKNTIIVYVKAVNPPTRFLPRVYNKLVNSLTLFVNRIRQYQRATTLGPFWYERFGRRPKAFGY